MAIEPTFRGFNILHKNVEVNGLDIFYREAGSKNAFSILYFTDFFGFSKFVNDHRICGDCQQSG
jgi:hypothetical protein